MLTDSTGHLPFSFLNEVILLEDMDRAAITNLPELL